MHLTQPYLTVPNLPQLNLTFHIPAWHSLTLPNVNSSSGQVWDLNPRLQTKLKITSRLNRKTMMHLCSDSLYDWCDIQISKANMSDVEGVSAEQTANVITDGVRIWNWKEATATHLEILPLYSQNRLRTLRKNWGQPVPRSGLESDSSR